MALILPKSFFENTFFISLYFFIVINSFCKDSSISDIYNEKECCLYSSCCDNCSIFGQAGEAMPFFVATQ